LARAWDSGVGFMGLVMWAASGGIVDGGAGAAGSCGEGGKKANAARMTNKGFNIRASCCWIADGILMLRKRGWEA
jgi:hypothetical protein